MNYAVMRRFLTFPQNEPLTPELWNKLQEERNAEVDKLEFEDMERLTRERNILDMTTARLQHPPVYIEPVD